ncbi:MAG: hypothetical protein J7M18_04110 [Candidatus Eremiobacteraeota bacterium]|nr:hypothetical protein [Candidatus Eremiobacteraeota bacterium]
MLLDDILAANSRYDKKAGEPVRPRIIIITCMDPEITTSIPQAMGLKPEEAFIIRNAGNIITDDTIRSAAIPSVFHDINEIIILGHTDCAMSGITISEFLNTLSGKGISRNAIPAPDVREWLGSFINEVENIKKQVNILQSHL